jgi:hypothetical protein
VRVSERTRVSQTTVLSAMNAKRVERSSTRFSAMANWRVTVRSSYQSEPLPRKALEVNQSGFTSLAPVRSYERMPRFKAMVTACVRSLAPSFERMCFMCAFTVASVRLS